MGGIWLGRGSGIGVGPRMAAPDRGPPGQRNDTTRGTRARAQAAAAAAAARFGLGGQKAAAPGAAHASGGVDFIEGVGYFSSR